MMQKRETFKKGVSAQDGARKREDNIVSARKNKREERLNQKRRTQVGKDVSDRLNGSHGCDFCFGRFAELRFHTLPAPVHLLACRVSGVIDTVNTAQRSFQTLHMGMKPAIAHLRCTPG
jgi:Importin beta binding domain